MFKNMTTEKKLKFIIVVLGLGFILSLVKMVSYKNELQQKPIEFISGGDITKSQTIDSLQNLVDSLYSENFPCQVELNRYQIAYEIFVKRNPKAASQYGDIISNETE